ncbi:uncharacterized protein LOC102809491, partial [Saccoglossus kowalevskii]
SSTRAFPIPSSARSSSTADSTLVNSAIRGDAIAGNSPYTQQLNSQSEIAKQRSPVSQSYTTTTNILKDSHSNLDTYNQNLLSSANNKFPKSSTYTLQNNSAILPGSGHKSGNRSSSASSPRSEHSVVEDYITTVNKAATVIQQAYRTYSQKLHMDSEEEIRKLLLHKKMEKEEQMRKEGAGMDNLLDQQKRVEAERKRSREERARQARQNAIQELQQKREAKRYDVKEKAEQEMSYLQASGKVTKKPSMGKFHNKPRAGSASGNSGAKRKTKINTKLHFDSESEADSQPASHRPATASSVGRRVDEIFE